MRHRPVGGFGSDDPVGAQVELVNVELVNTVATAVGSPPVFRISLLLRRIRAERVKPMVRSPSMPSSLVHHPRIG